MGHTDITQQDDATEHGLVQTEDTDDEYEPGQASVTAIDLPGPEIFIMNVHTSSAFPSPVPKGIIGAVSRFVTGVLPEIRVVNEYDDEITVVVSSKRPRRLITAIGAEASGTGGGINLSTVTYNLPAVKMTLAPKQLGPDRSSAIFPLWTRTSGCGVVSIFLRDSQAAWIENTSVRAGTTVHFTTDKILKTIPLVKET